jgi:hypothetical protein
LIQQRGFVHEILLPRLMVPYGLILFFTKSFLSDNIASDLSTKKFVA